MSVINVTKTYPAPKSVVWEHLIKDELLSAWCMPSTGFALEKGQHFTFNIPSNIFFSGVFNNTVLDYKNETFLSYKCTSTKPKLDTVVKWSLVETAGKTTLSLEHSGFRTTQWLTKIMLKSGWRKMMNAHLHDKLTT